MASAPSACSTVEPRPFAVAVETPSGALLQLLLGPRCSVKSMKTQIAGLEDIPVDNQTLLLGGRVLRDRDTLASLGIFGSARLTLIRCEPLLSGRISRADVRRLVEDDAALEQAVDAFKESPRYDVAEVMSVITAVTTALLPGDARLVAEILQGLPLNLLSDPREQPLFGAAFDEALGFQAHTEQPVAPPASCRSQAGRPALRAAFYDIGAEAGPSSSARERRERFTSCVRAALEVLLLALDEQGRPTP